MIVCRYYYNNHLQYNYLFTFFVSSSVDSNVSNEPKSQLSMSQTDKKSVKTILSQFLPSSTPPAIIPVCIL